MKVEGSCHCGAVTFEAAIDPDRVRICHCSDCQTLSGTAFRVVAPTPEADFHLISGEPTLYVKIAESGALRQFWYRSKLPWLPEMHGKIFSSQ